VPLGNTPVVMPNLDRGFVERMGHAIKHLLGNGKHQQGTFVVGPPRLVGFSNGVVPNMRDCSIVLTGSTDAAPVTIVHPDVSEILMVLTLALN
jgi:hypothetical protein